MAAKSLNQKQETIKTENEASSPKVKTLPQV